MDLELLAVYMEEIKIKNPPHSTQENKFQMRYSSKCEKQTPKLSQENAQYILSWHCAKG